MVEHEKVIGPTQEEIAEINDRVKPASEEIKPPAKLKIGRRLAGGVLALGLLSGACSPQETQPLQTISVEKTPEPSPTPDLTVTPTEKVEPTETPEPTEEVKTSPEVVRPDQPEIFGAGGPDEEFRQRVESGEFSEQEELLEDWVKGPWAEQGIFHPETERVNFKYFQDLETDEIEVAIESEDYPNQAIYFPLNLEVSPSMEKQVFDTMPVSPDPGAEREKSPLFLTLAGSPEGTSIPEDAVLAIKDGNWLMVNPEGQTVGEINLETGQWQVSEYDPETSEEEKPRLIEYVEESEFPIDEEFYGVKTNLVLAVHPTLENLRFEFNQEGPEEGGLYKNTFKEQFGDSPYGDLVTGEQLMAETYWRQIHNAWQSGDWENRQGVSLEKFMEMVKDPNEETKIPLYAFGDTGDTLMERAKSWDLREFDPSKDKLMFVASERKSLKIRYTNNAGVQAEIQGEKIVIEETMLKLDSHPNFEVTNKWSVSLIMLSADKELFRRGPEDIQGHIGGVINERSGPFWDNNSKIINCTQDAYVTFFEDGSYELIPPIIAVGL